MVNNTDFINKRAEFFMANYGSSNNKGCTTMFNCLCKNTNFDINCIETPSDFSMCYRLLQEIPEWKNDLFRLKELSKEWINLIDNWGKLTDLYEVYVINKCDYFYNIQLYALIQTLIK